jgi:tripartite-type tricarboxylate transporter receptor subunit TctC
LIGDTDFPHEGRQPCHFVYRKIHRLLSFKNRLNVQGWNGLAGPAGMPKPIVDKLNRETVRVLYLSDVQERLLALGAEVAANSPAEFAAHMKSERELWGKFIKQIGLRLD